MAKDRNLKASYQKLRKAGFSSADATRFRGASAKKIEQAILDRVLPEKSERHVRARQTPIKYIPINEADKRYLSKYSYKVSFKRQDGTADCVTITNNQKMTKKQIRAEAVEIIADGVDQGLEKYAESKIILGSITIEYGIINEEG